MCSNGLTGHLVCLDSVLVAHDVVVRTIIAGSIADTSNADTNKRLLLSVDIRGRDRVAIVLLKKLARQSCLLSLRWTVHLRWHAT